jgi:hypothetical protein
MALSLVIRKNIRDTEAKRDEYLAALKVRKKRNLFYFSIISVHIRSFV